MNGNTNIRHEATVTAKLDYEDKQPEALNKNI